MGLKVPDSLGWRSSRLLTIVYIDHHGLGVFSGWRSTKPQMILYIIMALANAMCS